MCIYICICICLCIHIYMSIYIYIYMLLICTYVCTDIYTYTHIYICLCLRVYIHAHVHHIPYASNMQSHVWASSTHRVLQPIYTHKHTTYIYPKCIHSCIRYAVSRLGLFYKSGVGNDIHRKLIIHTQTHHVHPSDMHTCIHIYSTCSLAAGLPLQIGCGQGGPRSICARG